MKKTILILITILTFVLTSSALCAAPYKTLLIEKRKKFTLLIEGSSPTDLKLHLSAVSPIEPSVFDLQSPLRLVADISGVSKEKEANLGIEANDLIARVRIGNHSDKLRLVLDLKQQVKANVTKVNDKKFTVLITPATQTAQSRPLTNQAAMELPVSKMIPPSAPPEPLAAIAPAAIDSEEPEFDSFKPSPLTAVAQVHAADESSKREFTAFSFEIGEPNSLVFNFTQRPEFRLIKKSDREFLLMVPQMTYANESLKRPQFPVQDFSGLTHVIFGENSSNRDSYEMAIIIGVELGVRLVANVRQNAIVVRIVEP